MRLHTFSDAAPATCCVLSSSWRWRADALHFCNSFNPFSQKKTCYYGQCLSSHWNARLLWVKFCLLKTNKQPLKTKAFGGKKQAVKTLNTYNTVQFAPRFLSDRDQEKPTKFQHKCNRCFWSLDITSWVQPWHFRCSMLPPCQLCNCHVSPLFTHNWMVLEPLTSVASGQRPFTWGLLEQWAKNYREADVYCVVYF